MTTACPGRRDRARGACRPGGEMARARSLAGGLTETRLLGVRREKIGHCSANRGQAGPPERAGSPGRQRRRRGSNPPEPRRSRVAGKWLGSGGSAGASRLPERSKRRRTGIEPARRRLTISPVLKTGRDTSPLSPPGSSIVGAEKWHNRGNGKKLGLPCGTSPFGSPKTTPLGHLSPETGQIGLPGRMRDRRTRYEARRGS